MTESAQQRMRKRESLITISFTIFSVFLIYVSMTLGWSALIVPLLAAEVGFAWWAHVAGFSDYLTRAVIITTFASVSVFFYGTHAVSFYYTIPTMCVFTVLFSLYQLRPALDIVYVTGVLLFLYHALYLQTPVFGETTFETDRVLLGYLAFIVLNALVYYSVFKNKEIEEEVSQLDAEIEKVRKIKDDFVANTSHELRTPINTISGMSEILLQENLPESAHEHALDIQMTGIELQTLVTDILDYAALEAESLKLAPRAYNITSTINDVMNMTVFQNREKNLNLIFDVNPKIPCLLYGDEQQLRRVMNNLIGNAIKFTSEGGVTVSVDFRPEEYGVNLLVGVKDTGIGLSREQIELIFQDFYQADAERSRTAEGMGLGLTISRALVKEMGGFLTVKSTPGHGSEFVFSVPQEVRDERPCISVAHPEQVSVIWYSNSETTDALTRDDLSAHINHVAENLDIQLQRANSLAELKRRVAQGQYTHLFISMEEYQEDPLYFDDVSSRLPTILIVRRNQEAPRSGQMHVLYKPYNAMTLAEIFNGGDILVNPRKYLTARRFEAPEAKVLVVDDNIMNLKVVEGLLRKYRIRITAASSGDEALTQIESKDYDFVFMDHMMPNMDGIECFHRIRAKQGTYFEEVPIIALTANAIAGSREMFLEEGFSEFVAKPIDNAILFDVLERFIPSSKKHYLEEGGVSAAPSGFEEAVVPAAEATGADTLSSLSGIDIETALMYCGGDVNDFVDLANIYYENGHENAKQIQGYFDAQDWKNYAILVHALKSSSKTIGAIELSDVAYTEEVAAKAEDVPTILANHEKLMSLYQQVLATLGANKLIVPDDAVSEEGPLPADAKSPERLVSLDITEWRAVKEDLSKLLDTFEADAIEDYVNQRSNRSYLGKDLKALLSPMLKAVAEFDFDAAREQLELIGGSR